MHCKKLVPRTQLSGGHILFQEREKGVDENRIAIRGKTKWFWGCGVSQLLLEWEFSSKYLWVAQVGAQLIEKGVGGNRIVNVGRIRWFRGVVVCINLHEMLPSPCMREVPVCIEKSLFHGHS